jgi:hypothetical protein
VKGEHMADYQYISIDKTLIPYQFDIQLAGRSFTFDVRYNAQSDFFTIDLRRGGQLIVAADKIMYGRVLFVNQQHLDVPAVPIIPYDLAMNEKRVGWDNLGVTVFLWLPQGGLENG